MKEYLKGSTSFSSRNVKVDKLELPTIVLCFNPPYNQSAIKNFGYTSLRSIVYDSKENYKNFGLTPWQMLEKIGYQMNDQLSIQILGHELKIGSNNIKGVSIELWPISTFYFGLCYAIMPQKVLWPQLKYFYFTVSSEIDLKSVTLYLTSPNAWHGIYENSWPHFDPTKLTIDFDTEVYFQAELSITDLRLRNGVENVSECLSNAMNAFNCKVKCYPLVYNSVSAIPVCKSFEEMNCIINEEWNTPERTFQIRKCLRPDSTNLYKANTFIAPNEHSKNTSEMEFWFIFTSEEVEVKEEMPVIGLASFIGSVGGSLGLFLGFSMYSTLVMITELFIRNRN